FVGIIVGAGCTETVPYVIPTWDEVLKVYAEAKGPTEPFLSLNPDAGAASKYVASTSMTDGVSAGNARVLGQAPPAPFVFTLSEPLPQNYYLNLSSYQGAVVWFSDSMTAAASMTHLQLRVEIFSGPDRVGGSEFTWTGGEQLGAWIPFYLKYRPEVAVLKQGDLLSLKITRLNGGFDLQFGTHGKEQSFLEFHYYSFDPLSSAVYLEGRKQFFAASGEDTGGFLAAVEELRREGALEGDAPATYIVEPKARVHPAAGLALGLLGAPLLGMAPRVGARRLRRGLLLALVLLGAMFSGCLSTESSTPLSTPTGSAQPQPTASVSYEKNETLAETAVGAVRGWVRDEYNLSIIDAHVSLLGTSNFGKTDAGGRFNFPQVAAGQYLMRIDHGKFLPLEKEILVRVGEITHVNVTLTKPVVASNNRKEHTHDEWGDAFSLPYPAVSFVPQSYAGSGAYSTSNFGTSVHPYFSAANSNAIPVPDNQVVKPGTGIVEVTLKWTGGPRELGLRVVTPLSSAADQIFLARASGVPFRIAIFPNEADPGHQKFTNWAFYVQFAESNTYAPQSGPPVFTIGSVNFQLTLHKSVVPLERAHRDFWNGLNELPIFERTELKTNYLPTKVYPNTVEKWAPPKGVFIPPGTSEIRGEFEWKNFQDTSLQSWGLVYKPANMPPAKVVWKPLPVTGSGPKTTFVMKVDPAETDQFYQAQSSWLFAPDDKIPDQGTAASSSTSYEQKWFLTLTAVKDAEFVD
ncbi:MAG: carboxypeptidase regulatory-like domain-containing protein, partial [Euryarchaeota archaeon]|nr:carboxypeptidase regulatory-like domain-containing protein [Euryarchaeota archaeon]